MRIVGHTYYPYAQNVVEINTLIVRIAKEWNSLWKHRLLQCFQIAITWGTLRQ